MDSCVKRGLVLLLCLSALAADGLFCCLAARTYRVAVVSDGSAADDEIVPRIEAELKRLTETGVDVEFKLSPDFDANWERGRMRRVIENAMQDRSVNYILATGLLVTQEAARADFRLTKPVVSCFGVREDIIRIPTGQEKTPLKENISLMVVAHGIGSEIAVFRTMVAFDTLHVMLDPEYIDLLDAIPGIVESVAAAQGVTLRLVPVATNAAEGLVAMGRAQAVLLAPTPRLSAERRRQLMDELNARGIPTFSTTGYRDVEAGVLASDMPDMTDLIVRRAAINLNLLMRGTPVAELPVVLQLETRLLINGRTAQAVGYHPNNVVLTLADFLYREALEPEATPLSFTEALATADTNNIELKIKDAEVEISRRDKQRARSPLLPQLGADAAYSNIQPFVEASIIEREAVTGGLSLSQMIYDDQVVSDFRSSGRLYEGEQFDREARQLDVFFNAGTGFLHYALARILYRIDADNVRLTRDNLDLSKVRYQVGYSGQDEVFRWQAQLSSQEAGLFRSAVQIEEARITFNRVLGVNQGRSWLPAEITVDPAVFPFLEGRIDDIYKDPAKVAALMDFVVAFAQTNAPELEFYDKAVEAQGIQVGQRTRTFFVPKFGFNLDYFYQFKRVPEQPNYSKDAWFVAIEATYPIFNGAYRYYDRKQQQASFAALKHERELTRQQVERRVRVAMRRVQNSFPTIALAQTAAENAHYNLDIVRDKYAQGIVNVITLLDAQNRAFASDQAAAGAVYAFLLDLVELQRAIAWFEDRKTEQEKDTLAQQIRDAVNGQ